MDTIIILCECWKIVIYDCDIPLQQLLACRILPVRVLGITDFSKVAREDVRVKKSNCTTGIRTRDPSLVISGALPTELWCSCQPRQNRTTLSLEHQTHFSCKTTQAGGTQPSTVTHTFHIESTMRAALMHYINYYGSRDLNNWF